MNLTIPSTFDLSSSEEFQLVEDSWDDLAAGAAAAAAAAAGDGAGWFIGAALAMMVLN